MAVFNDLDDEALVAIRSLDPIECGKGALEHFPFAEQYRNLNHGAYGVTPRDVRSSYRFFQDRIEARPDVFTRYEYRPYLLDKQRKVMSEFLGVPMETCVFVPNSTTAFDTIIRNLVFQPGDVIIGFPLIYESFENTIIYLTETTPVEYEKLDFTWPVSDEHICGALKTKIRDIKAAGKRPVLALFDTVTSTPGILMPSERLTFICETENVLSCIDGAHGVGQLDLDLGKLNPDFFMSNLHKWLYVPRACAVLYVPLRNQHLMRSTLPTGFAFKPLSRLSTTSSIQPSRDGRNDFTANFASTGTLDDTPYMCISAALEFRKKIRWSERNLEGEEAIKAYSLDLAQRGGRRVASILGTSIFDNEEHTLTRCALTNIRLPLKSKWPAMGRWVQKAMTVDYQMAVSVFLYANEWWVRLSAQIYLTLDDFDRVGWMLKLVCERAENGNWPDGPKRKTLGSV